MQFSPPATLALISKGPGLACRPYSHSPPAVRRSARQALVELDHSNHEQLRVPLRGMGACWSLSIGLFTTAISELRVRSTCRRRAPVTSRVPLPLLQAGTVTLKTAPNAPRFPLTNQTRVSLAGALPAMAWLDALDSLLACGAQGCLWKEDSADLGVALAHGGSRQ